MTIMAFSNDVGYEHVFSEQLKNLVREGDVVIAISASGNSPNVVKAVELANEYNAITVGMVGFSGGKIKELSDVTIHVKDDHYGRVEDAHLILNHMFVDCLAEEIKKEKEKRMVHE